MESSLPVVFANASPNEPPEVLASDIDSLRQSPPIGVHDVCCLEVPRLLAGIDGTLHFPGSSTQALEKDDFLRKWDLRVAVRGGAELNGAYDAIFWLRLRFCHEWPAKPPAVRFLSVIHHCFVEDGEMQEPFFLYLKRNAWDEASRRYRLQDILTAVHKALTDPHAMCPAEEVVALPVQHGAPEYQGTVAHPALGPDRKDFKMRTHAQRMPKELEGRWEALGQRGAATIFVDSSSKHVAIFAQSPLGDVELNGEVDDNDGTLFGDVIFGGSRDGSFTLVPVPEGERDVGDESANAKRLAVIHKFTSMARHPELFAEKPDWTCHDWLDPGFSKAMAAGTSDAWCGLLMEHSPGEVYSFPLFTDDFCEVLLEEVTNFYDSGLPARRPNSMNNYGIVLAEIGLEPWVRSLQDLVKPLGEVLWPGPGCGWDGHHCFIVRYREGEDLGLDMHVDDSEVTFNICLGFTFEGAGLQFCGISGTPTHRKERLKYSHVRGRCVVHLGRHRHGADDIVSGERLNLILWNHSSEYRKSSEYRRPRYDAEDAPPDLECLSYTHDRDFGRFRPYPPGKAGLAAGAWCPPRHAEYAGFEGDAG